MNAIRLAQSGPDVALARSLFEEYAAWLDIDLCFQGFDAELAGLPGAYAPPAGRLFLAGPDGQAVACIALRPFEAPRTGEVKRLYVQPSARGSGVARRLVTSVIQAAGEIGYTRLVLDTLERMRPARALYAAMGFVECARYYDNPRDDVVYMERRP